MKFLDVCSGIGGGRLGLILNNFECIGHSEINKDSDYTYNCFFGQEINYGDLMQIDTNILPEFDFLIGGFPCQTFSIVGKRAGFNDNRGLVIYGISKILKDKNVPYFLLENVKGLINHDKGNTLKIIIKELEGLGYKIYYKVLDSLDFGVPQMRERVYIVGIKSELLKKEFMWPEKENNIEKIEDYLINYNNNKYIDENDPVFQKYLSNKYNNNKYSFEDLVCKDYQIIDYRQSDLRIYYNKIPTLRTGRHGILYSKNKRLYKISGKEALLFQGFPFDFLEKVDKYNISDNKLLSQAGNAMTVPVIKKIVKQILLTK